MIPEIERMNNYLEKDYGYFNGDSKYPNYRMVWSDDQFEKRWVEHDLHGNELVNPIVELRAKYRQYIHGKWILEVLIPTPPDVVTDRVMLMDYEPLWVFGNDGTPAIPIYGAVKFVVDLRQARMYGPTMRVPLKDPRAEKDYLYMKQQELEGIKEYLFGNETPVGDALAHGHGVGYTKEIK